MVEGFENNYGSRAVLWRNMTRITILFENSAARLLPNGQRFEDRFPFFFPCRNWCQQRSHYSFFISLGALTPVAGQSEAQISYSGELFPEPRSLPRLQLPFTGRKHKVRKFVLPYFSGRLFSKGLVKLSVAEGFDLWRCRRQTTFDLHAQSTTLDSILGCKSNFGKNCFQWLAKIKYQEYGEDFFLAVCLDVMFPSELFRDSNCSFIKYTYCHSISKLNLSNSIKLIFYWIFKQQKIYQMFL